jgi:hypothetical protein
LSATDINAALDRAANRIWDDYEELERSLAADYRMPSIDADRYADYVYEELAPLMQALQGALEDAADTVRATSPNFWGRPDLVARVNRWKELSR